MASKMTTSIRSIIGHLSAENEPYGFQDDSTSTRSISGHPSAENEPYDFQDDSTRLKDDSTRFQDDSSLVMWSKVDMKVNTIPLVVHRPGTEGAIDGDLQVVGAEPVPVGVHVREEAALQHLIRARFDARHQVRRAEGDLLHLGKVVGRVAVEHQTPDRNQRELGLWPHLVVEIINIHINYIIISN